MANNKTIGDNIKKYRLYKGLTQKQLASLIGKTESSIQKYEAGKVEIPRKVLFNIAKQLDCSFIQLNGINSEDFLPRLRETNSDPLLIFLDSIGYKVTLGGNGGIYIEILGETIPLMKKQYDLLKEQVISYTKFVTERTLYPPIIESSDKPPTTE
ncbi:helix-turn-helix domain-containing protein [Lacrimispora sp. 210928-DFI.3.58]|uniref:helix-turn-helix domain-containing protein n=1 Tax=Lacrimispora sp. 210928-DFI.3.58 TaxID=2883214 RepID=UPI001D064246|nr:helix-turn-helix transcriptional regulator [Lacrimispora sp. 210928-DFI.3.58]MCB7321273.1 helix-turn-helix domain-containing protein [Lacrimispora sp. 210928-DFI.3.58]